MGLGPAYDQEPTVLAPVAAPRFGGGGWGGDEGDLGWGGGGWGGGGVLGGRGDLGWGGGFGYLVIKTDTNRGFLC